jgi:hypothetical protein
MMLDDLERVTKLWKDGALTDAEFDAQKARLLASSSAPAVASDDADWDQGGEPKASRMMSYAAYALIVAAAGGAAVLAYAYTSTDKQMIASIAKDGAAADSEKAATGAEEISDEPPADEVEQAKPEAPAKPFVGHLTCTMNGQRYLVYTCLVGKNGMPGGSLKIRTRNGVKQYTENDIISTMQRDEMIFDLTNMFEVNIQAGGDEYMTLRFDVKQGGNAVYSDETTGYGVINISG